MNKIEKIHIINLEERKDRWLECISQFEKYNISTNKYERFNAIKPDLSKQNKLEYNGFHKILSRRSKYIQGALGCKLSHISILEKYVNIPNKIIMILEDDFELCNNFLNNLEHVIDNLDILKNWNMCYLGFSMSSKHNSQIINIDDNIQNNIQIINKNSFQNIKILKKCHTTHAYIINTTFIPQLLEICYNEPKEIDVCYTIAQDKYNIYGVYPCLIGQREGFSSILNKNVNYNFLIPN